MNDKTTMSSNQASNESGNRSNTNPENEVDWLCLAETVWHIIFTFLDAKSLLNASETCQRFDEIFSSSAKLLNKVKISLKFPEIGTENYNRTFKESLPNVNQLTRSYQTLEILRFRDPYLSNDDELTEKFFSLGINLAKSVKVLIIENCCILTQNLILLLFPFIHLRECSIFDLMLEDYTLGVKASPLSWPNASPNLKILKLVKCDFFCLDFFFKSFNKLESLVISEPAYIRTDIEILEDFLLQQTKLQELSLKNVRFNSTYSTNCLAKVPFQLKKLSLNNVNWDISDHCAVFMKSQNSLECLELCMFQHWIHPYADNHIWFNSVMKHFLTKNPKLTSLKIDTKQSHTPLIKDEEFLTGVLNNNIQNLTYNKGSEDKSEFFKIFTRILPKVQSLSFSDLSKDSSNTLENIRNFKHLESLKIKVTPKSLSDFQLGSKLLTFKYCAVNEEKSSDKLARFFAQNLTIKNLALNIEPLTIEEIISVLLSLSSTLETLSISDLHLNPTEAELIAENFKSLSVIRSDFPLNSEILKILKNANIHFEMDREFKDNVE